MPPVSGGGYCRCLAAEAVKGATCIGSGERQSLRRSAKGIESKRTLAAKRIDDIHGRHRLATCSRESSSSRARSVCDEEVQGSRRRMYERARCSTRRP